MKAKEFIPASKPRNFVAKNQKTAGAGAHKDKKKAEKQGDVKHKAKQFDEAEKKGLYYYVNKRKKAGTSRPASHPKAPTAQAWKDAAKTAKKEGVAEGANVTSQIKRIKDRILQLKDWNTAGTHDKKIKELQAKLKELQQQKQGVAEGLNELAPAGGDGGNNYGGDLYDILMGYISENHPDLIDHFGEDLVDTVVSNMSAMGAFNNIDPENEDDLEDAVAEILNQLEDESGVSERVRDPEDWDEGNTEPPNNFAIYINGKKWKVFKGRGQFADDQYEKAHFYQLKDWARKKSEMTGKKWEVYITGEAPTA